MAQLWFFFAFSEWFWDFYPHSISVSVLIVQTAIAYSEEKNARAYQAKNMWPVIYLCSLVIGMIGTLVSYIHRFHCETLITSVILGAVFGAYFCFFVKTKLPAYYDENKCGPYYDGPFRMNIPGVAGDL